MLSLKQSFASGELEVDIIHADLPPDDLFEFAARENPKRPFLFVSKVLGRHIPVSPACMRHIHTLLASGLDCRPESPCLFIGMAETAIALAAGVFREFLARGGNARFLCTTRHKFSRPVLACFEESHSHATEHIIYEPQKPLAQTPVQLVLVDDEMTTGNTFVHLVEALPPSVNIGSITKVVLTDWRSENARDTVISLLQGAWRWQCSGTGSPVPQQSRPKNGKRAHPVSNRQDWGRFGMENPEIEAWPHIHAASGEKILVLGTGEFVWPPFLLAERLEKEGAQVFFGATTRSPIKIGLAIQNRFEHMDNYGLGMSNYLYNVQPEQYDKIYLCCETPAGGIDPNLLKYLGHATPLEYR